MYARWPLIRGVLGTLHPFPAFRLRRKPPKAAEMICRALAVQAKVTTRTTCKKCHERFERGEDDLQHPPDEKTRLKPNSCANSESRGSCFSLINKLVELVELWGSKRLICTADNIFSNKRRDIENAGAERCSVLHSRFASVSSDTNGRAR
jgi:hypothetical protein